MPKLAVAYSYPQCKQWDDIPKKLFSTIAAKWMLDKSYRNLLEKAVNDSFYSALNSSYHAVPPDTLRFLLSSVYHPESGDTPIDKSLFELQKYGIEVLLFPEIKQNQDTLLLLVTIFHQNTKRPRIKPKGYPLWTQWVDSTCNFSCENKSFSKFTNCYCNNVKQAALIMNHKIDSLIHFNINFNDLSKY
jgi:hypothetical protein